MVSDISANGGLVRNDFTGTLVCLKGAEGFVGVERRGNFWVLSSAKGPQVNGRGSTRAATTSKRSSQAQQGHNPRGAEAIPLGSAPHAQGFLRSTISRRTVALI
eukprot:9166978-Pyramimonas_sp.AAC.1